MNITNKKMNSNEYIEMEYDSDINSENNDIVIKGNVFNSDSDNESDIEVIDDKSEEEKDEKPLF